MVIPATEECGDWSRTPHFSSAGEEFGAPLTSLLGKNLGLVGLGCDQSLHGKSLLSCF